MNKTSFFEKLTGAINADEEEILIDGDTPQDEISEKDEDLVEEQTQDAELSVDVYETQTEIVIQTMVAGVAPTDVDVSITRDVVTISGKRDAQSEVGEDGYFHRELFWGSFSRSITLPEEVEVDESKAEENHGLLTIRLPKIDKDRKTQLKIKAK